MSDEIASAELQRLLGINKVAPNDLAKRGIDKRGNKRGTFVLEASVSDYCNQLRDSGEQRVLDLCQSKRARTRLALSCHSRGGCLPFLWGGQAALTERGAHARAGAAS
jgi:hypothetical protein